MGEELLRHYADERRQSAELLGDVPPPDEEEKLERLLLSVKEHERRGWLESDRTSPSWKEWRRRQARKKEAMGGEAKVRRVNLIDL